ncbi:MAG: MFS transporter [Saprospiraceae bacterium]|nr:MFS transporter [Saprospiraceae bacterium]
MSTTRNNDAPDMGLFWGCFIALIATSFGFIIRALIIDDWEASFNLTQTQKGELLGVGLWPFAISIVLFSLVIDRIGYRMAMIIGLICHVLSAIITITAKDYTMLYIGTFICALGNGTVEAYINPVVGTLFRKDKTKWFNILHAGWPGGMVAGGLLLMMMGGVSWQVKVGLIFIPTILYAVLLWNKKFPVHERVAAGVSYKEMLKEVGILGAFIISLMVFKQLGVIFGLGNLATWVVIILATGAFGFYTKSLGKPLFIVMLLIMIPLAITELGVDSWSADLMAGEMGKMGISGGWVLIYTALLMMLLRFFGGPIIHKLSPIGLLAACAALAALGLYFLSSATGGMILLAATLYAVGKSFFWPTSLGIVAEQFPKGGALTLNGVAAVGMLAAGIVGGPFLGNVQDKQVDKEVAAYDAANNTQLHSTYVVTSKTGIFGDYMAVDGDKLKAATNEADKTIIGGIQQGAKKGALKTVAILPVFMLLCYIGLLFYFRSQGGYKPVLIGEH